MNTSPPLVCNMDVFTPAQRDTHILKTTQLFKSVGVVREVEGGFDFTFPKESGFFPPIAEFIANERLCCPFLTFTLSVVSNHETVSLSLTGPVGTKDFLRTEFDGAIP